jgi:hypothetical protein
LVKFKFVGKSRTLNDFEHLIKSIGAMLRSFFLPVSLARGSQYGYNCLARGSWTTPDESNYEFDEIKIRQT